LTISHYPALCRHVKQPETTVTYIPRNAESRLKHFANGYPVLVVTGPHQSGKSTLVRHAFPEHHYVSLEDLDQREFAETDPRGFLNQFTEGAILDEAQRCPALFSYLQTRVDERQQPGEFILTGSQQFGLLSGITQSLAGRACIADAVTHDLRRVTARRKSWPESR
jgi:predicted AAA+ superfamily ATPase